MKVVFITYINNFTAYQCNIFHTYDIHKKYKHQDEHEFPCKKRGNGLKFQTEKKLEQWVDHQRALVP